MLYDHLAVVAPPDQLVGVAIRDLREPNAAGGNHRGLTGFRWVRPSTLRRSPTAWARWCTPDLLEQWRWVHDVCGGPGRCAANRYLHGVRLPGVPMLRPVTCAQRPERGGGRLDELTGVLGLPIDLDVASRRPGDRRPYCPTIGDGLAFLERYRPSLILDAGGGLVALWLFDRPADPVEARRLGRDLVAVIGAACARRGWCFDSPPPHSAWVKAPGCVDLFRRRVTREVLHGPVWAFDDLRAIVPRSARPERRFTYEGAFS